MSVTYSFVCDDCKESCWAGQGNSSRDYLYSYKYIDDFIYKHKGHKIRFLNDEEVGYLEYNSYPESDEMRTFNKPQQFVLVEVHYDHYGFHDNLAIGTKEALYKYAKEHHPDLKVYEYEGEPDYLFPEGMRHLWIQTLPVVGLK